MEPLNTDNKNVYQLPAAGNLKRPLDQQEVICDKSSTNPSGTDSACMDLLSRCLLDNILAEDTTAVGSTRIPDAIQATTVRSTTTDDQLLMGLRREFIGEAILADAILYRLISATTVQMLLGH